MKDRIDKTDLGHLVAKRLSVEEVEGEAIVDAVFEEIYEAIKMGQKINILHFGTFHVDQRENYTIFEFRLSQRLRALLGWSNTYKGEL